MFLKSGGFPSTKAQLTSSTFTAEKPEYFGGEAINETLSKASSSVAEGLAVPALPVYANSVYADTVGQAYQDKSDLNAGLEAWQKAIVKYGNEQGFKVTSK